VFGDLFALAYIGAKWYRFQIPTMKQLRRAVLSSSFALFGLLAASACDSGAIDNGDGAGAGTGPSLPGGSTAGSSSLGHAGTTSSVGTGTGGGSASAGGTGNGAGNSTGSSGASSGGTGSGGTPSTGCSDMPPNNGDTCAHAVEYGWCSQSWLGSSCQQSCGKCSGGTGSMGGASSSSGGSTGSAGAPQGGGGQPPVITDGKDGWATRYWDCCKPACGWKANVPGGTNPVSSCSKADQSLGGDYDSKSACDGNGPAYMCGNFGPWAVSDTLAYGFAAVNQGSDFCGRCFQLQFTGKSHNSSTDPGSQSLAGKTMIVQALNNGGVDGTQFDLLIPGGGVGDFNACSQQWGTSDLGEQYGGFFLACQKSNGFDYAKSKACAAAKCESVFAGKPDLLAGCNFFVNWFGAPDNPALKFKEVTCPAAITSMSGLHR